MLKQAAISFYGNEHKIALALGGYRTVSSVYQWKEVVPLAAARKLEMASAGKLRVDISLYDELGHGIRLPKKKRA